MDCTEFLNRYSEYDDSVLDAVELSRFRGHLSGCASCARYDRVLRKGRMLARQLPVASPGDDFLPRLQRRLVREGFDRDHRAARRRRMRERAGVAGVALVVFLAAVSGAVSLLASTPPSGARAGAATSVAAVDAHGPLTAAYPGSPVLALPASELARPRDWPMERVDRRESARYSPFVAGPPAYRVARAYPTGSTTLTRRTLD